MQLPSARLVYLVVQETVEVEQHRLTREVQSLMPVAVAEVLTMEAGTQQRLEAVDQVEAEQVCAEMLEQEETAQQTQAVVAVAEVAHRETSILPQAVMVGLES